MDGYFVAPPPVQYVHPVVPVAIPYGNCYQVNHAMIVNFWSVRDLWLEDGWRSQSEVTVASSLAQVQPPAYTPYESMMIPVVMSSW